MPRDMIGNNRVETGPAGVIIRGHASMQNLRRGH